MNWYAIGFSRGPFFQVALLVFIVGMTYRFVRILLLGWTADRVPAVVAK